MPDVIELGPLRIPGLLAAALVVYAAGWTAGVLFLSKNVKARRVFGELFSAPLIPFILVWKLSLLFTDFADVVRDPLLVVYSSGAALNFIIGGTAAVFWTIYSWSKHRSDGEVNKAMIRGIVVSASITAAFVAYSAIQQPIVPMPLPAVVLDNEDGDHWDISMSDGKPIVLNFWASWCPPCKAEMPMLAELAEDTRMQEVVFFAVNAAATEKNSDDAKRWLESQHLEMPLLFDNSGEAARTYGISALPTTIVLDSKGRPVEIKTGVVSRRWILRQVKKAERRP